MTFSFDTVNFDMTGRAAIVTGAAGGLGESIAHQLAKHGAAVLITDRSADRCSEVRRSIEKEGGTAVAVPGDLTIHEHRQQIVQAAEQHFGRLDVLVNNAGIRGACPSAEISTELYDEVHDINTKSAFFLSQEAFPHLSKSGRGSIINMISIGIWNSGPGSLLYRSSKAAMHATTMVLAREWAEFGIRVNDIAPGAIDAGSIMPTLPTEFIQKHLARTPMGRLGKAQEIASAVIYLASDASSFVTGSTIRVDGGAMSI